MRTGTACPACNYSRPRWRSRRGTYICEHCGQEWGTEQERLAVLQEQEQAYRKAMFHVPETEVR